MIACVSTCDHSVRSKMHLHPFLRISAARRSLRHRPLVRELPQAQHLGASAEDAIEDRRRRHRDQHQAVGCRPAPVQADQLLHRVVVEVLDQPDAEDDVESPVGLGGEHVVG